MLKTETRNEKTMHIDRMSTEEMVSLVVTANYEAVKAAEDAAAQIAAAVELAAAALKGGHRLYYIGAGTSGRLGVIDAAECPPTFGVPYDMVQGIIAGGKERMFTAGENAEDSFDSGFAAIDAHGVTEGDMVIGISAAGGAKYVIGALTRARELGCPTAALSSNENAPIFTVADVAIHTDTGAEAITGSTRLKAGTAQKIVLNAISTCAMIKTGKVYENMMINLRPSNEKLKGRVIRITSEIKKCDEATATRLLEENDWNIRRAVEAEEK